jgi:hypothetical protein
MFSFIFFFTFGSTWYVFMFLPAKQRILQNLWKLLVQSPFSRFGVVSDEFYTNVGGIK